MTTQGKILVTGDGVVRAAGADEAKTLIHEADIATVALALDHAEAFR
ncbi:hypothetical protein K1W54_41085 [Micromonospora sp. CPCC 205371]|nr:hypothetical protein [Micromonospora sp. CPCC 205371]